MCVLNPKESGSNDQNSNDLMQLNSPEDMTLSTFNSFVNKFTQDMVTLDHGRLAQSLSLKLTENMQAINCPNEQSSLIDDPAEEVEDKEGKEKLNNIEIELEDIAQGVRDNL